MAAGREGDWECSGCKNRNYAFRSFCNRCKQPRLLVDNKTPSDSKWLPRIGDWICTGCTNNNYASREKCKKCGQPKEAAAMPATAMPGVFAGMPGLQQCMNMGILGSGTFQKSLSLGYSWPFRGSERYNAGVASALPLGGCNGSACPYTDNGSRLSVVPKGWRSGDWICNCGFHNYSSRTECKKCNAGPPGLKRLASEDLTPDWDNKRLNAGPAINQYMQTYPAPGQTSVPFDQELASYPGYLNARPAMPLNLQARMQLPQLVTTPTLIGKGAKQWRHGDWMCTTCNNHNYASRDQCNRCKTQRSAMSLPVDAA